MEHFIISGLNEQQTLVCLIVAAFAFIGAAEYLIGLMAAKSVVPAFVPAFWQSGDGDGGCGNRVVKCDLMSARSGSVSAAKATSGKKFTRRGYFGTRVLGFAARSGATAARSVGKVRRP